MVRGVSRANREAGAPVLALEIRGVTRVLLRCPACADELMPEIPLRLPPRPVAPLATWTPLKTVVGQLPKDFKMAQCREPGED